MHSTEFENLLSLLESTTEDSFRLGLILAQNYQEEFKNYFGCQLKDLEKLINILVKEDKYHFETPLTSFEKIGLVGMKIKIVPKAIYMLKRLKDLRLSYNQITSISTKIGNLKNVETLDLCHNHLEKIPSQIGKLKNLKYLYLDHNNIEKIPPEIGKLENIKHLDLSCNQIKYLPEEICNLKNLTLLYLQKNRYCPKFVAKKVYRCTDVACKVCTVANVPK